MKKQNQYLILLIFCFFTFIPFFLDNKTAFDYEFYNYCILQIILFALAISLKEKGFRFILSPSVIAISYINLNFMFGSYLFSNDLVFTKLLPDYKNWNFFSLRIGYFNLINLIILLCYFIKIDFKSKKYLIADLKKINYKIIFFVTILFFIISLFFEYEFSIVAKSLLAICIFIIVYERINFKKRIFIYLFVILLFSLFSTESKREAIFLLLPIILLETSRLKFKFSFKKTFYSFIGFSFVIYLILVMSILRGYGGFKSTNFLDASKNVVNYIKMEAFIPSIANNLEISSTYLHSNNVIEYINKDKMSLLYGETMIKPFFIFIPRSAYKDKPKSAIDHYTSTFDSAFREKGGSYPVSVQSEFYLNFGWFAIILIIPFMLLYNVVYKNIFKLIKNRNILNYAYLLYTYELYLVLVRGSGLDIFLVYFFILITLFLFYKIILRTISQIKFS